MALNKRPRIFLIVLGSLLLFGYIGLQMMQKNTKRHSPEATARYAEGGMEMQVKYCRPYKKGRQIFGGLVPYDQVWRTGANEATTFTTTQAIRFGGTPVEPGTYTLWTIPGPENWQVILNSKRYGWGVTWGGEASRDAQHDVAKVSVPVQVQEPGLEQFTIDFRKAPLALTLAWDQVHVEVPIE